MVLMQIKLFNLGLQKTAKSKGRLQVIEKEREFLEHV
ncbi:Uncharacterised protein [uncultured archaeon]|nr:Uncharacterised protein [uncultured archaeon]